MPGMPLRGDRIHRYVAAFCPECHRDEPGRPLHEVPRLAGYLAERDGQIWLERGCGVHGRVTSLYDESPEILRYLEEWTAPSSGEGPVRFRIANSIATSATSMAMTTALLGEPGPMAAMIMTNTTIASTKLTMPSTTRPISGAHPTGSAAGDGGGGFSVMRASHGDEVGPETDSLADE